MNEEPCERQKMGTTDNCTLCRELNNDVYNRCKTKNR